MLPSRRMENESHDAPAPKATSEARPIPGGIARVEVLVVKLTLYRASRTQRLRLLLVPTALPYFLAGLKIAGGLSLIGAVVAEFTAGAAGRETGLASRILEASFRTEVPKMFAALLLVSLTGIAIFLLFNALGRRLLGRWHDSETAQSERGTSR